MQYHPNLNFELFQNEALLHSLKPHKNKKKTYVFSILGFILGSIVSLFAFIIEDILRGIPVELSLSHFSHFIIPTIIGLIGGFIGFYFDKRVNLQKTMYIALYESQQTLRLIADNLPSLISYIDIDRKYRFCNKRYQEWHNLSLEKIYGRHISDIIDKKAFERITPFLERAFTNQIVNYQNKIKYADGIERYTDTTIVPHELGTGEVSGLFVLVNDITDIRNREEQIIKQNEALRKINSTKDRFFSIIAHDLKAPFNTILGYSNLLMDEYPILNENERKRYVRLIQEGSRNTSKLLENLLQWSLMQTGGISARPEQVNITSVIMENISLLKESARQKGITIETYLQDFSVTVDLEMINTVVRNLLSNGIKFSYKNSKITISDKRLSEGSEEYIEISIKDEGMGIKKSDIKKIFRMDEAFSTPGTDNENGSGLGLLLCKEFIEKNHGKIWVESKLGKGSVFKFTLPVVSSKSDKSFVN